MKFRSSVATAVVCAMSLLGANLSSVSPPSPQNPAATYQPLDFIWRLNPHPYLNPQWPPHYYGPRYPVDQNAVYTTVTGTIIPAQTCATVRVYGGQFTGMTPGGPAHYSRDFQGSVQDQGPTCTYTLTVPPQFADQYPNFFIEVEDEARGSACLVQPVSSHQPGAESPDGSGNPIPTLSPVVYPTYVNTYTNLDYRSTCAPPNPGPNN